MHFCCSSNLAVYYTAYFSNEVVIHFHFELKTLGMILLKQFVSTVILGMVSIDIIFEKLFEQKREIPGAMPMARRVQTHPVNE